MSPEQFWWMFPFLLTPMWVISKGLYISDLGETFVNLCEFPPLQERYVLTLLPYLIPIHLKHLLWNISEGNV